MNLIGNFFRSHRGRVIYGPHAVDGFEKLLNTPGLELLTQPIFEGGALKGQLAYTKGRYEELLQNYRKAIISAFSNVEDALAATQRTAEQQASQEVAVAKAQRAYELALLQYRAGSVDLLTVLNTENALFSANDLLAQIRIARMQALVSLFNALGGGWQDSGSQGVAMAATAPPGGR